MGILSNRVNTQLITHKFGMLKKLKNNFPNVKSKEFKFLWLKYNSYLWEKVEDRHCNAYVSILV